MKLFVYEVLIFVGQDPFPAIGHRFYGQTQAEALQRYQLHLSVDAVLAGCVDRGLSVLGACRVEARWLTITAGPRHPW